ncbi:MAG: 30S ribosomal protein S20 [Anaeroplasmataceae bacterium]
MANIKQQIKRVKTNEKARQFNASYKSGMKTAVKAVLVACENNDKAAATAALAFAFKKLDKAQAKGIVHKNFVANKKSELSTKVNAL